MTNKDIAFKLHHLYTHPSSDSLKLINRSGKLRLKTEIKNVTDEC